MSSLVSVPFFSIDTRNFEEIFPQVEKCLEKCHYIALDLELSGIGLKGEGMTRDLGERYQYNRKIVQRRGILSLGLSTFRYMTTPKDRKELEVLNGIESGPKGVENWCLKTAIFNIYCKPPEDCLYDDDAKTFLQEYKFDFERQEKFGVPYSNQWLDCSQNRTRVFVNRIFDLIVRSKKPIVFHNGFLDLAFFYGCFFAPLPDDVNLFSAHLKSLFPSGIYDTKFFTIIVKLSPSYLQYIFSHEQRKNLAHIKNRKRCVLISYEEVNCDSNAASSNDVKFVSSRDMFTRILSVAPSNDLHPCSNYSKFGWCSFGTQCQYTHNIDAILDHSQLKQTKSEKQHAKPFMQSLKDFSDRLLANCDYVPANADASVLASSGYPPNDDSNAHHAALDAFMTGYTFAAFLNHLDKVQENKKNRGMVQYVNNIFVTGSDGPFIVRKSESSHLSQDFHRKLQSITAQSAPVSDQKFPPATNSN